MQMKIRCDVCEKEEASLFCSADEAALCNACDHRVHFANKLASKHLRFSLLQPNSKESPLCDICQEKRAFLFCQEDRAILCRDCDVSIHKVNEHTKNHNRFLLTGIKLSSSNITDQKNNSESQSSSSSRKKSKSPVLNISNESPSVETKTYVSEYLIETLPGWRVDDFLDPSTPNNGICKPGVSFYAFGNNQDLQTSTNSFSLEDCDFPPWVTQIFPESNQVPFYLPAQSGLANFSKKTMEENKMKLTQKRRNGDDAFAVPQISPQISSSSSSGNNHRHVR